MEYKILNYEKIKYVIRYPDGYEAGKRYPVLFYIHGAGGRGDDINVIRNHSFFSLTEKHNDLPFVCIAPQCYANTWFDIFEQLKGFIAAMVSSDFCDASRVYLMGASMGGYTTWQLGMSMPEIITAIVPICGGGMNWNTVRLKDVPVWAFHGEVDGTVYLCESEMMVKRVNAFGGSAKLTVYEGVAHNAWEPTFNNREVFEWLLSHEKKSVVVAKDGYGDVKKFG